MNNLTKKIVFFICILSCQYVIGQGVEPVLKSKGQSLADLKPANYKYVSHATGDLNGDHIPDLVFIVQGTDPTKIQLWENLKDTLIDSNKRTIAIYLSDSSGILNLHFQNTGFIKVKFDENEDDPFDFLEITDKGVLKIGFKFWTAAGTWESNSERYLFRFNKDISKFELIGYYYFWYMRDSFEGEEKSVNFPAGKMSTIMNPMQDEKAKPVWKKFTLDKLKTLDEIVAPGSWQFEGMYI